MPAVGDQVSLRRPTFTIGIPVRNASQFLAEALRSAIRQHRPADEIVVIDDASTDDTASIAQSCEWNGRVRYVYNGVPTGWADAFNRVAKSASGDFIIVLCADDLLAPDHLLNVERAIQAHPSAGMCYCGNTYIDSAGMTTGGTPGPYSLSPRLVSGWEYRRRLVRGICESQPIHRFAGVAVDRSLWTLHSPVRPEAGLIADTDFFLRAAALRDVVSISAPLASVRCHRDSVSSQEVSLALRLAQDYLFQVRWYSESSHPLDNESAALIYSLAARFVTSLLYESLRRVRPEWHRTAKLLRNELRQHSSRKCGGDEWWFDRLCWFGASNIPMERLLLGIRALSQFNRKLMRPSRFRASASDR